MNQIGIDISNAVFDATMQHDGSVVRKPFSNTKTGHRQFIRWALYQVGSARVCLEATGVYHLQLALALDRCPNIELMVVNPCAARRFAQAQMVRAKTDAIDADGLLQYVQRMAFQPWAVSVMIWRMSAGVSAGFVSFMRAATPATKGVAMEVPLMTM